MAQDDQDKSLPASPFKLQEARKKGQVAKSVEFNSWLILSAALLLAAFTGPAMVAQVMQAATVLMQQAGQFSLDRAQALWLFQTTVQFLLNAFWPLIITLIVTAILASLVQIGPIFTLHPLKPDFNRLNPVSGFKRLFSQKMLFEAGKTLVKLLILIAAGYALLRYLLPQIALSNQMDRFALWPHIRQLSLVVLSSIVGIFFIIAIVDLVYVRYDFAHKMRMSTRELKDEVKRREGDPHIRAKRKQLQKEYSAKLSALSKVPQADVVITNPEHIAVALQYDRQSMAAPTLIAKGTEGLAHRLKQRAQQHGVVIVENKPLARRLYRQIQLNQMITPDLFPDVAQVLLWVYRIKARPSNVV